MGRKWVHQLVLLVLAVESFSQAQRQPNDYPAEQHHQHLRRQQQHHHHQHHQHHRHRNQTSSSYSLLSGPGGGNGATDYRSTQQHHQQHHHQHQQQHYPPQQQPQHSPHWSQGVNRETPPQHRRHHRAQATPQQQDTAGNGWRRVSGTGSTTAVRPVNRMLTRSGTGSFGITRQSNGTRNVCTVYIYRKAVINKYNHAPCTDPANCSGMRTYSAPVAKREVCCRGWDTTTTVADGCFKPVCQTPCRNGGQCIAPDRCSCPAGYTGKYCELDVNECKEHKPCDQTCYNTEGSFYCTCRDGFVLQSDRQSCRKIDDRIDQASEARDMENDLDVDYDSLDIRLRKLEEMMSARDDRQELTKKVQYTMDAVSVLKSQVARLTQRMFPSVDYGNRVH